MRVIKDVARGELHSAYVLGAFDKAKKALEAKGYRITSLEENAGLRVQEGINSSVSQMTNITREAFIYDSARGIFLSKKSPIMANAKQATDRNRKENDFYLTDEQVEESLADSVKITNTEIPTRRFADEALTSFAFGKNAKAYGELLDENEIKSIQVNLATPRNMLFARQAWLCSCRVDDNSAMSRLEGYGVGLSYYRNEVRGVRASD